MHFQHPESRKNHTFRFFSNFSRHGSCGYATKVQKQHKIRIWPWSVHCTTQLRVPADHTALSLNCFFRTNARNWMSVHEVRPWGQQKASKNSILASKLTSMSTTRWYFMNGQRKFTTLKFSDSIWNSAQFIRSCVAQWTDQKSSIFDRLPVERRSQCAKSDNFGLISECWKSQMSAKITELDGNSDPAGGAPGQIFTAFSFLNAFHQFWRGGSSAHARSIPKPTSDFYINVRICNFRTS